MLNNSDKHIIFSDEINEPEYIPPPVKIEQVKLDKVYAECKQVSVNEIELEIDIEDIEIENEVQDVKCISVKLLKKKCQKLNHNKIRVWIMYEVTFKIDDEIFSEVETFEKTVIFGTINEKGLTPQCEVFLECLDAFASKQNSIILCVGKLFLFKLTKEVQLLIPTYGFCPEPQKCVVTGECPDYELSWPPYPKQ